MADNVAITAGTGTTIAADDIAGVLHQRVKLSLGADGTAGDAAVGAGTASGVLRTTLASDDPAVTKLGLIVGATSDAKVVTDATGTPHQYLRGLVTFFANALGAGTAAAAHRTTLASDDPAVATLGATSGAKVVTDATGTIQQYLRGLVTFFANALGAGTAAAAHRVTLASDDPGVVAIAATTSAVQDATLPVGAGTAAAAGRVTLASDDPAVAALGAISGAAVITDANGTVQQYLRGLVKQWIAGTLVLGTGANAIGKLAANAGVNIGEVSVKDAVAGEYETVAASQTSQVIGATGGTGDYLSHVVVSPVTTSPGVVTIADNATIVVAFPGGSTSLSNLIPFTIPVGIYSSSGAWKITTGANLSCTAVGNFT